MMDQQAILLSMGVICEDLGERLLIHIRASPALAWRNIISNTRSALEAVIQFQGAGRRFGYNGLFHSTFVVAKL